MYSSGCVWQWAAPPSDIQQEWFGSFYLFRRSLFNDYGDHRSLGEIHGNSNRWPQEHLKCGAVLGIQPFTAWGVKEICCANLFFVPRCSPSPNRNQPTCLSWGPSVSCAKLEVCPAQIKTTSHLDVRTMAHAENVDGWCQRSFPCKLPLGRQESQCLLYPVPVWWRGKAARHEPQPCRFGLRPTQVSLWSVFSLVHGRLCTLRYLKLSDLLELPWVFCLFLEEKAEGHTRKKKRTWNWKEPLHFCEAMSSGSSPKNQRLPAPNHQWLWWLWASHVSGSMRLTLNGALRGIRGITWYWKVSKKGNKKIPLPKLSKTQFWRLSGLRKQEAPLYIAMMKPSIVLRSIVESQDVLATGVHLFSPGSIIAQGAPVLRRDVLRS